MARVRIDAQRGGSTVAAVSISAKGSQHLSFNALALKEFSINVGDRFNVEGDNEVPFTFWLARSVDGRYKACKRNAKTAIVDSGAIAFAGILAQAPKGKGTERLQVRETHVVAASWDGEEVKVVLNSLHCEYAKA